MRIELLRLGTRPSICPGRILATFLIALAVSPQSVHSAPVQWPTEDGGNGHWYAQVVPPNGISWHDAKTAAENWIHLALPGYLATITSAEENDFLQRTFDTHISWIGLTDEQQQGTFEWITGEPVTYTNWFANEPMNRPGEDYVQIEQGLWNDNYGVASPPTEYGTQKYLVEWSSPRLPDAPNVSGVLIGGLTWAASGYSIPLGTFDQSSPLSFTRINQLSLTFDEHVTFGDEQATLSDSTGNEYALFGPLVQPGAEPGTYMATWQTEEFLDIGRYTLHLGDGVVDDDGNALDGEWTDDVSTSSGDGIPGGDFAFTFNVLPGDVNQDGLVNIIDAIEVRNLLGTDTANAAYSPLHDIDARGSVDMGDVYAAMVRGFDSLPPQVSANATAAVPEPSSVVYVFGALALLGIACARRRVDHRENAAANVR